MASTKIINVLKDDKFEEILDLFRNTSAQEIIFVLPKTSKTFKNEDHFIILENEAKKSNKKISLLCSSPGINNLAKKYRFDVLLAKDSSEKPPVTAINQFSPATPSADEDGAEEETEDEEDSEEEEKEVTISAPPHRSVGTPAEIFGEDNDENDKYQIVTVSKIKRGLEDIMRQSGTPLKIASNKERIVALDVKKKPAYKYPPIDEIKNVWKEQEERIPRESIWTGINDKTKKSFRNFPKKSLIILGVISVILFGIIIYISTGSAKIDISPAEQSLDIQLKISSSDEFFAVDAGLNKIPGQLFNVEKNASQTFLTTGEKEVAQKARGKITVFNEYGTAPQILIATTRFQTSDGLIFRTLKGITVPGTKVENGKIIPGSTSVEVIADKPGQSYNIPAGKFSIPAFNEKGDSGRYEKIYGRSNEAMRGGAVGKASVVTETDFNYARKALSDQVNKDIENSLKTQTAGLKIINTAAIKLKEPESTAKIDEAADSFIMTIDGSIKTIGFKENDLENLIKQYIDKTKNLAVIPEKLTISYVNIIFDESTNTLTFIVDIKGNGYAKVDVDKIKADLAGKNERDIKDYFKETNVESVKVVLSPFWIKRIPQDKERIKVQINH